MHSDDLYTSLVKDGYPDPFPIAWVFVDASYLATYIDQPTLLPGKTVEETAGFWHASRLFNLAAYGLTRGILRLRCHPNPLRWTSDLSPYLTATQIAQLGIDADQAIAALGGCAAIPPD
jgi:hypothetical protein